MPADVARLLARGWLDEHLGREYLHPLRAADGGGQLADRRMGDDFKDRAVGAMRVVDLDELRRRRAGPLWISAGRDARFIFAGVNRVDAWTHPLEQFSRDQFRREI